MLIGPYGNEFRKVKVWSMHNNNKEPINKISDRQRGCLAIKGHDKGGEVNKSNIRKGMIMISKEIEQNVCYQFTAEIEILAHSTVISPKYTPVIHCGTIRQSARIVLDEGQNLKLGDKALVKFRFVQHPEFMEKESIFFFREGTTRGVGTVKDILAIKDDPDPKPAEPKKARFHKQRRRGPRKNNGPSSNQPADKTRRFDKMAKKSNIEII
jgi:GTPase